MTELAELRARVVAWCLENCRGKTVCSADAAAALEVPEWQVTNTLRFPEFRHGPDGWRVSYIPTALEVLGAVRQLDGETFTTRHASDLFPYVSDSTIRQSLTTLWKAGSLRRIDGRPLRWSHHV